MGKLLFGLNVSASADADSDPVADAQAAEAAGFDFVSVSDHPSGSHPSNETWTTLVWIAASTSRIAVASRVLGLPFRNPVMTAKMAETLDRLSGGRLILGMGAGGSDEEIASMGLPSSCARDKIDALDEALSLIRGLWAEPSFSYSGRFFRTRSAELEPKPARRIPIWLGTFGPRALEVTGRLADGWIPSLGYAPADQTGPMLERVLAAAGRAGRDPADIARVLNIGVRVDEHAERDPDTIVGSAERVIDELARFAALGFTGFNFLPLGLRVAEQVHRLTTEVIPALT